MVTAVAPTPAPIKSVPQSLATKNQVNNVSKQPQDFDTSPAQLYSSVFSNSRPSSAVKQQRTNNNLAACSSSGLNAYGLPAANSSGSSIQANSLSSSNYKRKQIHDRDVAQLPTTTDALSTHEKILANSNSDIGERIKVCVRKRPLSNKELQRGEKDIVESTSRSTLTINEPK